MGLGAEPGAQDSGTMAGRGGFCAGVRFEAMADSYPAAPRELEASGGCVRAWWRQAWAARPRASARRRTRPPFLRVDAAAHREGSAQTTNGIHSPRVRGVQGAAARTRADRCAANGTPSIRSQFATAIPQVLAARSSRPPRSCMVRVRRLRARHATRSPSRSAPVKRAHLFPPISSIENERRIRARCHSSCNRSNMSMYALTSSLCFLRAPCLDLANRFALTTPPALGFTGSTSSALDALVDIFRRCTVLVALGPLGSPQDRCRGDWPSFAWVRGARGAHRDESRGCTISSRLAGTPPNVSPLPLIHFCFQGVSLQDMVEFCNNAEETPFAKCTLPR